MAKPVGQVQLVPTSPLYDPLLFLVPYANDGGPARILSKGGDDSMLFSASSGTEADAWIAGPLVEHTGASNKRRYYTTGIGVLNRWPLTIGMHFKARATSLAYPFGWYDAADETNQVLWLRGAATGNTRLQLNLKLAGTDHIYEGDPGSGWSSGSNYSVVFTLAGASRLAMTSTPTENHTMRIDEYIAGVPTLRQYRWRNAGNLAAANDVTIGGTINNALNNLKNAIINGPGAGTAYHASTPVHETFTAERENSNANGLLVWHKGGLSLPNNQSDSSLLTSATHGGSIFSVSRVGTISNIFVGDCFIQGYRNNTLITNVTVSGGGTVYATLDGMLLTGATSGNSFNVGAELYDIGTSGLSIAEIQRWGNLSMDYFGFFDRVFDATDLTNWHNEGIGGAGNYGMIELGVQPVDFEADGAIALTGAADRAELLGYPNDHAKVDVLLKDAYGARNPHAGRGFRRGGA